MILELKGIYKDYQQGKMNVPVLKDINFSMEEGEYVAIMGPSGSGKTTLMNIIGCLDKPTKGEFFLDGQEIGRCSENDMSDIRLNKIGFVFQSFHLLPRQSAAANVELPLNYPKEGAQTESTQSTGSCRAGRQSGFQTKSAFRWTDAESCDSEGDSKQSEAASGGRTYRSTGQQVRGTGHGAFSEVE